MFLSSRKHSKRSTLMPVTVVSLSCCRDNTRSTFNTPSVRREDSKEAGVDAIIFQRRMNLVRPRSTPIGDIIDE